MRATILAEESPACGQSGRVRRVFWRQGAPWVVLRCQNGPLLALPWQWTDLPMPVPSSPVAPERSQPVLLTPQTLVEFVRFVRYRASQQRSPSVGGKGRLDDSRTRPDHPAPGRRSQGVRLDAPARPAPFRLASPGTIYVRRTRPHAPAPAPDRVAAEEGGWPEPESQALLVLFTALAERRVQAARAQEETHEDHPHHHGPSRAASLRLRAAIDPVAGERTSGKH